MQYNKYNIFQAVWFFSLMLPPITAVSRRFSIKCIDTNCNHNNPTFLNWRAMEREIKTIKTKCLHLQLLLLVVNVATAADVADAAVVTSVAISFLLYRLPHFTTSTPVAFQFNCQQWPTFVRWIFRELQLSSVSG